MKAPWSMMPMLFPLSALILAILLNAIGISGLWIAVPCAFALVLTLTNRRESAVICMLIAAGMMCVMVREPHTMPQRYSGVEALYSGYIEGITDHESNLSLHLLIDSIDDQKVATFDATVTLPTFLTPSAPGYRICFKGKLTHQTPLLDLPDEIDPMLKKCNTTGFISSDSIVSIYPAKGLKAAFTRLRLRVSDHILTCGLKPQTAEFINAVTVGDTSQLRATDRDLFAASGLSHVLALSGLHVGLILWITGLLLYPLFPCRHSRLRLAILITAIWAFALLSGAAASVCRAAIMATVILLADMLHRRQSPFNSLFLAAMLILAWTPDELFRPGFQLTFAAVAAIIAVSEPINSLPYSRRRLRTALSLTCIPIAAMAGTLMISAYYFHSFPIHFLGANILSSFILPPLMLSGIIAAISSNSVAIGITDELYTQMRNIAEFFGNLPGFNTQFYPTTLTTVLACTAITLLFIAVRIGRRGLPLAIAGSIIICTSIIAQNLSTPADSGEEIYFARSKHSFDIIVRTGKRLLISTNAPKHEHDMVAKRAMIRYDHYIGRRGIDSVGVVNDFTTSFASKSRDILKVGNRVFLIPVSSYQTSKHIIKADLILTSKFSGKLHDALSYADPDTVFIASDLNPRRASRYMKELAETGIPIVNLREQRRYYTSSYSKAPEASNMR